MYHDRLRHGLCERMTRQFVQHNSVESVLGQEIISSLFSIVLAAEQTLGQGCYISVKCIQKNQFTWENTDFTFKILFMVYYLLHIFHTDVFNSTEMLVPVFHFLWA